PSALGLLQLAVASGPATRLTLEGLPVQVAVDAVQSVTVTVRDAFDNPVTDYAGNLRFTNTDTQASSVPDATFVPSDGGVQVVTVRFATSGRQSLSAADIATPSIAGSASTLVLHGPVLGLLLSGIPPQALSGA